MPRRRRPRRLETRPCTTGPTHHLEEGPTMATPTAMPDQAAIKARQQTTSAAPWAMPPGLAGVQPSERGRRSRTGTARSCHDGGR